MPTLRYLFQDAHAREYLRQNPNFNETLHNTFWRPRGLNLDTSDKGLTLEEILTVIRDYEKHTFNAPDLPVQNVAEFRKHLYALSKRAVFDGKSSTGRHLNLLITYSKARFEHTTWGSFNWDCLFEASYYYHGGPTWEYRSNPTITVNLRNWRTTYNSTLFLKLHGGVNWWYEGNELVYLPFGPGGELDTHWREYEQGVVQGHPVLLEPSFYKYDDPVYNHLKPQWDRFVQELLQADVIIVIGYSLPEADPEARRALTIAFQGNPTAKFIVFDKSDWVRSRYVRIFGNERLRCIETPYHELGSDIGRIIDEAMAQIGGS
ncbi:MAG: hypothetical protein OEZ39_12325 [Gammaproteobacteria bacterium]|nr:hypothetical protein [Gammaproteobacteria bacterium]